MSLEEKKREAKKVYELMQARYPDVCWGPEQFMLDLVEEIGELSNALLVERGHKFRSRQKSTLEDAFFDVLFDLFMLADKLNIDLDKAWKNEIEAFKGRITAGEFENKL